MGDEPAEPDIPEQAPDDEDEDGWPTLSPLELDVCVSQAAIPGIERPHDWPRQP